MRAALGDGVDSVVLLEQLGLVRGAPLYLRVDHCVTDLDEKEFLRRVEADHVDFPPIATVFERLLDVPSAPPSCCASSWCGPRTGHRAA